MDPSDVPKHEEGGSDKAQSGPEKIQGDFFSHVEQGESRKDHHGDDFLQDFQLREGEPLIADAVGGDLEAVFQECDGPADKDGDQ